MRTNRLFSTGPAASVSPSAALAKAASVSPSAAFAKAISPGFAILAKAISPGFAILAKAISPGFAILAKAIVSVAILTGFVMPDVAHADDNDDGDLVVLDGGFAQVSLIGLLQTQIVPWQGDDALIVSGDQADTAGARIRRARFGVKGWAWGEVDFELSLQAATGGTDILDAWVGYRGLTGISFIVGARKVPFSRFALMGAGDGALADRPLGVRALAPFRQVGLTIEGDVGNGILRWALGAYNGFSRSQSFNEGYRETTALEGNRFTRLAYVGRAELAPLGPVGDGMPDFARGGFRLGVGGSVYYDPGKTVETLGYEIDLIIKSSGFHFAAEFLSDSAEPSDQPTTDPVVPTAIDRMAFIAEAGYLLIGEELGITARFELLDDNTAADNNGDQIAVTGGLQYYLHRQHLKAQLEYTHRLELEGVALDNDSLLLQVQFEL